MFYTKKMLIGFLFILCSFSPAGKKKLNLVFIGDSITYGAGLKDAAETSPPSVAVKLLRQRNLPDSIAYSNQGRSGYTTVDFLPSGNTFPAVKKAAADLTDLQSDLIFSVMLGTNDSAEDGPNGSPVSPSAYHANLKTIIDSLLTLFPQSRVVIQYPLWYSPTTYNGSRYLQAGLDRLQSYFPEIQSLVKEYEHTNPKQVFAGDPSVFIYFKENFKTLFQTEQGKAGDFYLHPNSEGAAVLGKYWSESISNLLMK